MSHFLEMIYHDKDFIVARVKMKNIHLNCDLGEGSTYDEQLMSYISACNVACGGHAGTLETMRETVLLAMEYHVQIGAHPSYPDKENFGRSSLEISADDLKRSLVAQILGIKQLTEAEGGLLSHVKPHGALYNDAVKDEKIARIIIDAIREFDDPLPLYVPLNSVVSRLAVGKIKVYHEAFADRNYNPDYSLVARTNSNAVITKKDAVFKHLSKMFFDQEIRCENGEKIPCKAGTFCLHSDTPNSVEILQYLNKKFEERNVQIQHS